MGVAMLWEARWRLPVRGMVEGSSEYCRLGGGSFLLILAEMGVKEDGFRKAEACSWGCAGCGAASC